MDVTFKSLLNGRCKFLTADEEREHFRRWREEGDRESQDILFRSIAPLMLRQVASYAKSSGWTRNVEELESAAIAGTLRAMELWDERHGVRLSSYAGWWWMQSMRATRRRATLIHVPHELMGEQRPDGVSKKRWERLAPLARRAAGAMETLSPLDWGDEGMQFELADQGPAPDDEAADNEARELAHRQVHHALAQLKPLWRQIMLHRMDGKTLEQTGQEVGRTRERIRQIEQKARKKMAEIISRTKTEDLQAANGAPLPLDTSDPVELLQSLQRMPPEAVDQSIAALERERDHFLADYKRRKKLLVTLRKLIGGSTRKPPSSKPAAPKSPAKPANDSPMGKAVVATLEKMGGRATCKALAEKMGVPWQAVGRSAGALISRGTVRKLDTGEYALK